MIDAVELYIYMYIYIYPFYLLQKISFDVITVNFISFYLAKAYCVMVTPLQDYKI